ncbi:ATPase [Photobacterium aquae]|uniref:ATPase n=1 Tax=Photobacterium aquae TaxID=1195763 RepID=A0A0J1H4H9_9GAMM|nr:AAA family ATPase [Photobacterium aquae]KLV06670.1 ATPase [Photobacterium aquae]
MSKTALHYQFYGQRCDAPSVQNFLDHLLGSQLRTPVCIWGRHGIGKTELVAQIAKAKGMAFRDIAPAQFEEMGDLLGLPQLKEVDGKSITQFAPPEWVPREDVPGILLIDDVNRADDRILRGIMQLLQNHALVSWALPPQWRIVLTANPDGGDYSVTPMDDAMLTRMMHITLEFDPKAWAWWAQQAGIDSRGIDFVLIYPELVSGARTTPRSLVQFFKSIEGIADLKAELSLVHQLAQSCLDEATSAAFVTFVRQNLSALVSAETIVSAKDFDKQVLPAITRSVGKDTPRIDVLATLCTRLCHYLKQNPKSLKGTGLTNVQRFLKMELLPHDLRLGLMQDLMQSGDPALKAVLADVELAQQFLSVSIA